MYTAGNEGIPIIQRNIQLFIKIIFIILLFV